MNKVTRERITLKSRIFGDEITFLAVRCGSYFLISKRQAGRIPKDRGISMEGPDLMPVIVGDGTTCYR